MTASSAGSVAIVGKQLGNGIFQAMATKTYKDTLQEGEIYDVCVVGSGVKVFHHTGWWVFPIEFFTFNEHYAPITVWKSSEKDSNKFEHNHIEDGHSEEQFPTPRFKNQECWKERQWKKEHAYMTWSTKKIVLVRP